MAIAGHPILFGLGLRRDPPRLSEDEPASESKDQKDAGHLGGPERAKPKGVSAHKLTGKTDKPIEDKVKGGEEPGLRGNFGKPPKGEKDEEISHGLVEHGGMEGLTGIGCPCWGIQGEHDPPREACGSTEGIAVEEISDPAEGLTQGHRRNRYIR